MSAMSDLNLRAQELAGAAFEDLPISERRVLVAREIAQPWDAICCVCDAPLTDATRRSWALAPVCPACFKALLVREAAA